MISRDHIRSCLAWLVIILLALCGAWTLLSVLLFYIFWELGRPGRRRGMTRLAGLRKTRSLP